ncbi:hypothetical protein DPMN_008770 [Dreissena polymorpha]|uniref:Uncharacterized protein n=1 Tax=Dreissena polymorpha TaxID=45954 RepID=A0A9D4N002_DREPO|nr:hypothetical protein DPMN_008770 [Dreissena polymorpha]
MDADISTAIDYPWDPNDPMFPESHKPILTARFTTVGSPFDSFCNIVCFSDVFFRNRQVRAKALVFIRMRRFAATLPPADSFQELLRRLQQPVSTLLQLHFPFLLGVKQRQAVKRNYEVFDRNWFLHNVNVNTNVACFSVRFMEYLHQPVVSHTCLSCYQKAYSLHRVSKLFSLQ